MTNNEKYKSELDGVKASDAFKQSTVALLQQAQQEAGGEQARAQTKPKQKFFTQGRIVALAATLVLFVGGFVALRGAFMPAGAAAPMAEQATGAASVAADAASAPAATEDVPDIGGTHMEDAESAPAPDEENDIAAATVGETPEDGAREPEDPVEEGDGDKVAEESRQVQMTPNVATPLAPQETRPNRLPLLILGIVCLLAALVLGIVLVCKKVFGKRSGEK